MGDLISMATKITRMVMAEVMHWGMAMEIICRRVSMSLV